MGTPISSDNTVLKEVDAEEVIRVNTEQGPGVQVEVPPESGATDNPTGDSAVDPSEL